MNTHKSTPEQKRRRLLYVVIVIAVLFLLRIILLDRGIITGPQALSSEDLANDFHTSQVYVSVNGTTARGTILQISTPSGLGRQNKNRTIYILTTSAAAQALKDEEDAADGKTSEDVDGAGLSEGTTAISNGEEEQDTSAQGLDKGCMISFSNGSYTTGAYVSVNENIGAGIVSCTDEGLDFQADSVFFSENILYQLAQNSPCYYQPVSNVQESAGTSYLNLSLEDEAGAYGRDLSAAPAEGTYLTREAMVEGYDIDLMQFSPANGDQVMAGSGIFSDSGYFLGMVLATQEDGTVNCLPGNNAVDYFRTNH